MADQSSMREYLLKLPAPPVRPAQASDLGRHGAGQLRHYVRANPEVPKAPSLLQDIAKALRTGNQTGKDIAIARCVGAFDLIWQGPLPVAETRDKYGPPAGIEMRAPQVWLDRTNAPGLDLGFHWDRLSTSRFFVDTVELTGEKLAMFLLGPVALAEECWSRIKLALERAKDKTDKAIYLHQTPVRLYLRCDAYMLEGFSYVEVAGKIGAESPATPEEATSVA